MIDTVGGVEISLPAEIVSDDNITFPAGKQTLDGRLSVEFVSTLKPDGEAARNQRQNLFLQGLRARVISAGWLAKTGELVDQFD
jgi:anionic cell wall polymer biosynthesis LytR-Cps2A-Psr (LCP) family protein